MKIIFVSNFMNHHQLEISMEFCKNNEYYFIATEKIPQERVDFGYKDMNKEYSFIIRTYESLDEYDRAIKLINTADVVIFGSCPFKMIEERIKENKITFKYSERLFKNKELIRKFHPKICTSIYNTCTKYRANKYYLLCASAYSARDYSWFGAFKNKAFKWGYFPKIEGIDDKENLINNKMKEKQILWAGRFIKLKHPEYAILCAKYLKKYNINMKIKMVGTGVLLNKYKKIVEDQKLSKYIEIVGTLPFQKVQEEMKKSVLFLFTSDKNEGWGAVLNESMGNGCLLIANKKIGSVPYLINDGTNGFVYSNKKMFYSKFDNVIKNYTNMKQIMFNAIETIEKEWNAKNAVNNFLLLCDNLLDKTRRNEISSGPCSNA